MDNLTSGVTISVVMPAYNSEKYIKFAIESIIEQTYTDWELLIVSEFGSKDRTEEIIRDFEKQDSRIKVLQNDVKLGLAESLNKGFREAKGKYIARMDSDDISHKTRFEKQLKFMEENPNLIMSGTAQHHFGSFTDRLHTPACDPKQCKANLLFFCDMCHSTVMLRREVFINNNLFYDKEYGAEDFELWTRAIEVGEIANLPEVLEEYRVTGETITDDKRDELQLESGEIVLKAAKNILGVETNESDAILFGSWRNSYWRDCDGEERNKRFKRLEEILRMIYENNRIYKKFDEEALLKAIQAKWCWAKYYVPMYEIKPVSDIDGVFRKRFTSTRLNRVYYFSRDHKGISKKLKKIYVKLIKKG